jgi:PAS domain S-box-containing protein
VIENKYMDVISDRTDVLKILPEAAAELCTALFRNSPAGIYITRDGKFIYTNIEFRRITGYSQHELSGKDYLRLINPRYRHMPKQNMASLFEEEETETSHEFKITTHEGKKKWVSEKITYFKYGGNWLTLGHWLDVSGHHSVEKAWHEAERRFQLAFEDLATGLAVIGTDGIFLKVNKSFCDMLGLDEREVLESRFDDVLCPEDRAACGDIMALFLSMEKPEEPLHMRLQCKDGRAIWTAMSISLIGDNEAGPSYFMVNFQDITEQKRREEGLREEEKLYHSLVDLSLEPVAVADLDCHFTHISQNFAALLGYDTGQDLLGKKVSSLVSGEGSQQVEQKILEMLKQGTPGSLNHNILKKGGSLLPVQMYIAWINKDNGSPLCIVISLRTPAEQKPVEKQPATEAAPAGIQSETNTAEKAAETVADTVQAEQAPYGGHPLSQALENTTTALILLNQDTVITACNSAFEKLSGFSRQEIEGKKSWMEFVAREDQPRLKRFYLLRRLDPASSPNTYEFKFSSREGGTLDVLINISPIPGSKQLAATLLDLAEYKQAAAEAQASQQAATAPETQAIAEEPPAMPAGQAEAVGDIYRDVLEASPNAIVITDMEGTITFASRNAFERVGEIKPELMLGKNFRRFIRPGMLEEVNQTFTELKNKGFIAETEIDLLRHDGRVINCEISGSVIAEEDGPSHMAFVIRDISGRKQSQDALAENERSYRWMAENSTDSMWLMDLDLHIIWSNNVLGRMRGYSVEEARSMPFDRHLLPDSYQRVMDFYASWLRDFKAGVSELPHTHRMELQFFRKDDSVMSAECSFSLIEDEQGQAAGLLGIAHDISDRKRAEEHAARTLAQLDKTLHGAIAAMIRIVEMRDPYTSGHQDRVAALAVAIAREIGLPDDLVKGIEITARIHDIGKVYIPMEILSKPGTFTDVERQIIQSHAQGSYDILKTIDFPWPVAEAAYQHHERLDGSGYPRGLKENQIILEAKILMVADVVEAMASHRPYRPSCGIDAALEEISTKSGLLYDSTIVDYCVKLFREGQFSFNGTFSGNK